MIIIAAFAVMSLAAVVLTVYDKRAAKRAPRRRVPEATLMLVAALGGSFAMYAVMRLIRHKTLHPKFMVGIPVLMVVHAALIVLCIVLLRPALG
ncbi:MAG: DUF1294 domain-containing protein [Clostridia bacterium]|nr:DUF1294 domain-containing protein [Clostridia bacterium]